MHMLLRILACGSIVLASIGVGLLRVDAHPRVAASALTCQAGNLSIAPDTTSGATGHIAMQLRLRNISARSCTLKGYPTVVLLDGSRRPLLTVLSFGSRYFTIFNRPVRLVTLAPMGSAYFAMGWAHIPQPGQSCPKAPNLLTLPPGASSALLLAMAHASAQSYGPIDACGGEIAVSPITATRFQL
jgi:hypothetical protein